MKAMHLINAFLAGCIAFSFLGWIASLHPTALKIISVLLITAIICWGLAWILDDALMARLKISPDNWQAILVGSLAMLLIGLGAVICA